MAEEALPSIGDGVTYRVRQNPLTAPDRDYVRPAIVVALGDEGVTLVVCPNRSDPFQIGPLRHADDASPDDLIVWQRAPETSATSL